jgi:hypothetical protein
MGRLHPCYTTATLLPSPRVRDSVTLSTAVGAEPAPPCAGTPLLPLRPGATRCSLA